MGGEERKTNTTTTTHTTTKKENPEKADNLPSTQAFIQTAVLCSAREKRKNKTGGNIKIRHLFKQTKEIPNLK